VAAVAADAGKPASGIQQPSTAAAAAPTTGLPLSSVGRRSTRGNRAAALAAAAAAAASAAAAVAAAAASAATPSSDESPAVVNKRRAAADVDGSPSQPVKRSRRLATKMLSAVGGARAAKGTAMDLTAIPNRASCTLLSELGGPVATARIAKEKKKFSSRWIVSDMVAVELVAVLDASVAYPYSARYPIPGTGKAATDLDTHVGTVVVWSTEALSFS